MQNIYLIDDDENLKKKLMEDALSNEMNLRKNIGQIKDEINKINFRLHEAVEKLNKAQANSDASGRTTESLKLTYDNAKTEYEKANYTYQKHIISLIMKLQEVTIIKLILMQQSQLMILC